jgi:hypothetical protein
MGLFDLFRKRAPTDFEMRVDIVALIKKRLTDRKNRIRAEDTICAAAAIVGERCIDAAGDFSLRDHSLTPGARVFSDKANVLLCGDRPDAGIEQLPAQSVYGILKASVNDSSYPLQSYPTLVSVFGGYAAGIGKTEDWGKVPVTVLPRNHPWIVPLQFAFETRDKVDAIFRTIEGDKIKCLEIATKALAALLNQMAGAIEPDVALRLALEITNGMAKTAPMTKKALLTAKRQARSPN